MDLVPEEDVLNQPIFWTEDERDYLTLIGLKDHVNDDLMNIELGYNTYILPFMKSYQDLFE